MQCYVTCTKERVISSTRSYGVQFAPFKGCLIACGSPVVDVGRKRQIYNQLVDLRRVKLKMQGMRLVLGRELKSLK